MEAEQYMALLRRIRHDFLNQLQVILGYIDLDNPRQARNYIEKIVKEMTAERAVFERLDAKLAFHLYRQMLLAQDIGVIIKYQEIDIASPELLAEQNEPFQTVQAMGLNLKDNGHTERILNISVVESNGKLKISGNWEESE